MKLKEKPRSSPEKLFHQPVQSCKLLQFTATFSFPTGEKRFTIGARN
jgi:hypothetical protein